CLYFILYHYSLVCLCFIFFLFFLVFLFFFFFFFFQAEDGIRDDLVTGVQTCALPISQSPRRTPGSGRAARGTPGGRRGRARGPRSEERRVGKECRSRWARDH